MSFNFFFIFFEVLVLAVIVLFILYLRKSNANCKSKEEQNFNSPEKTPDEIQPVLQDICHRIKNNIQIVISLISLQIAKESNEAAKSALVDCQNRVKAMSIIHEKLYTSESSNLIEMSGYVKTLTSYLSGAYHVNKEKIKVIVDIDKVFFDLNTAIPLSQMINEILSNSFKHAFVFKESGEVVIKLSSTDQKNGVYTLSISDNGAGFIDDVTFPDKGKLGFYLISALARQMGGTIKQENSSGTSFEFVFKTK